MTVPYRGSRGPLNLLIDSTGIKAEGEGEWHARKHGGAKCRVWRKIHIGVDEQTLEIRAIEITGSNVGDAPMLPELLDQIPADVELGSVTADGAYDTRKCHDAVADRGAHAVMPPRRNAKPWKPSTAGAIARNEALRASKYLGRAIWRKWSGYHRVSPRRDEDALREALGTEPHGTRLRSPASPNFKSAPPFRTATPRSEYLSQSPWDKSVLGKETAGLRVLCATKPDRVFSCGQGTAARSGPQPKFL